MKIRLVLSLTLSFLMVLASLMLNTEVSAELRYQDINASSAIYDELIYLEERGIVGGKYSASHFYPMNPANRGTAIITIALALGLDDTPRDTDFSDVFKFNAYSGLIQSAVDKGIVTGYEDGTFKPLNALTRSHFALFIDRAFGKYLPSNSNIEFKDVPKTLNSYDAIKKLTSAGITTGYADGTFKPNETLTRAHLAIFLYRTVKYLEDKGIEYKDIPISDYKDSDIKRGMSYDSVYELVKNNITSSTKDGRIITNRARYGLSGTTQYLFAKNKGHLGYFSHSFDWSKEKNIPDTVSGLHKMYEEKVIAEFGVPSETFNTNTSNSLLYDSVWDMGEYNISLVTFRNSDTVTVEMKFFDKKKD